MVRRGEAEITRRPHVDEAEVPDARPAERRQLVDLVSREERQLRVEDRIEVRVLWRLAAEGVKQRLRFVHVVPDRRHPVQVPAQVQAQRIDTVVDIAVVVVEHVLAPVRRAAVILAAVVLLVDLVGVVPVNVTVASVDIGRARDADDDVVADLLDVRLLADGETICELDHRFRWIGLTGVEAGADVVVRFGSGDDLLRLRFGQSARIGNLLHVLPIDLEVLQVGLRRHIQHHDVAAFFRLAHDLGLDASWQRFLERAEILLLIGDVGQLFLGADVVSKHVLGRRDASLLGQMINKRRQELGLGRRLLHELGKVRVVGDRGCGRFLRIQYSWSGKAQKQGNGEQSASNAHLFGHCSKSFNLDHLRDS